MTRSRAQAVMVAIVTILVAAGGIYYVSMHRRSVLPVGHDPYSYHSDETAEAAKAIQGADEENPPRDVHSDDKQDLAQPATERGYRGSIRFPPKPGQNPGEESSEMKAMAKITPEQAEVAALDGYSNGTVTKVTLLRENGYLVYSVRVTDDSAKTHDVQVDAGNGAVLNIRGGDDESAGPQ